MDRPLFDLTLLGLADDSLLTDNLVLHERDRRVAPVRAQLDRVTLTYPALESSRLVVFIVAGEDKQEILGRVLAGDASTPAGRLRPIGDMLWLVDRAAAGRWY
jgi:6-phosphogluconolactonase